MFGGLLDFIFPPRCGGCRRAGTWFCATCAATASAPLPSFCPACGGWTSIFPCPLCTTSGWRPSSIRGLLRLEGPVQEAIHRLKYRNRPHLAEPLARLALSLAVSPLPDAPILAVPLHPHRQRERGYNQAEAVAQALAMASRCRFPGRADGAWAVAERGGFPGGEEAGAPRALGGVTGEGGSPWGRSPWGVPSPGRTPKRDDPVRSPGRLTRPAATSPQVGRPGPARRAAMSGAFSWVGTPPPRTILLVDDVVTTGATLLAAAEALHQAGATEIHCLALAQG